MTGPPAWLDRFRGRVVVVKYGGHALDAGAEPHPPAGPAEAFSGPAEAFAADVAFLRRAGVLPVVVHGGGPQISTHLARLGLPSEFVGGLRVTTAETLDVVRMVLVGKVNREIVGLINRHGPVAVGFSGEDGGLFAGRRRPATVGGRPVDIGLVGDVVEVDPGLVRCLLADGRVPVVAGLARDARDGAVYNVNADTAAAALAVALGATRLVILSDVPGLYPRWPATGDPIRRISAGELRALLPSLTSGMIPKMEACLRAVRGGVAARLLDGRVPHALLDALRAEALAAGRPEGGPEGGPGTEVVPDGAGLSLSTGVT